MKITKSTAVDHLERAHQASGAHAQSMREAATQFWDKLDSGIKEPRLKMRLLLSPSERPAMRDLSQILFQSGASISDRHAALDRWVQDNPSLFKAMSKGTQAAIQQIAAGRDDAKRIDGEIARAQKEVEQAFGGRGMNAAQKKAVDDLAHQASIEGAVQIGLGADIRKLRDSTLLFFAQEPKAELERLAKNLERPQTNTERNETWRAFRQGPLFDALLDNHAGLLSAISKDLSVHDWSDSCYRQARQAVFDAFDAVGKGAA